MNGRTKKILVLLSMLICVISTTACNKDSADYLKDGSEFHVLIFAGILFVIILLISILVMSFRIINKVERSGHGRKTSKSASNEAIDNTIAQLIQKEENEMKEKELVAVITAAIAAAEGIAPECFVVRSIKKANKNSWQKA